MKEEFLKLVSAGKLNSANVDKLQYMIECGQVFHRFWGAGKIRGIDTLTAQIIIDFHGRLNHAIDLDFAVKILKPEPKEMDLQFAGLDVNQLNWQLIPPEEIILPALPAKLLQSLPADVGNPSKFDFSRIDFFAA